LDEIVTMSQANLDIQPGDAAQDLQMKMWIYTNFDCNLCCSYCMAESNPKNPLHEMGVDMVKQLVDETQASGVEYAHFTGGEPLTLNSLSVICVVDKLPAA
jgi:molybdenum cofactor biosynthesis enzyme MoaA